MEKINWKKMIPSKISGIGLICVVALGIGMGINRQTVILGLLFYLFGQLLAKLIYLAANITERRKK